MRHLILTIAVYLAAVLQTSLIDGLRIGRLTPDLVALVAMVWVLTATRPGAFLVAGGIGLVGDLLGPGRIGLGMAGLLLAGYGIEQLKTRFFLEGLPARVATVGVAVSLYALALATGHVALGTVEGPLWILWARAAGVGLYTGAISLPVLMVVGWIHEPHRARRQRLAEF